MFVIKLKSFAMKLKISLVTTLTIIIISINMFMFNQATSAPAPNIKQEHITFMNERNDRLLSDRKHYSLNIPLQNWQKKSIIIQTTNNNLNKD